MLHPPGDGADGLFLLATETGGVVDQGVQGGLRHVLVVLPEEEVEAVNLLVQPEPARDTDRGHTDNDAAEGLSLQAVTVQAACPPLCKPLLCPWFFRRGSINT
jgi:hypothetical protein